MRETSCPKLSGKLVNSLPYRWSSVRETSCVISSTEPMVNPLLFRESVVRETSCPKLSGKLVNSL